MLVQAAGCERLSMCDINNHWRPFVSRCGYCDLAYRYIARSVDISVCSFYLLIIHIFTIFHNKKMKIEKIISVLLSELRHCQKIRSTLAT